MYNAGKFCQQIESSCLTICYIYLQKHSLITTGTTMPNATTTKPVTPPIVNPEDRNAWKSGFTPQAEIWNGRFAMLGFAIALLIELTSGQGLLHFWGLI
jgi:hypothetical protein